MRKGVIERAQGNHQGELFRFLGMPASTSSQETGVIHIMEQGDDVPFPRRSKIVTGMFLSREERHRQETLSPTLVANDCM